MSNWAYYKAGGIVEVGHPIGASVIGYVGSLKIPGGKDIAVWSGWHEKENGEDIHIYFYYSHRILKNGKKRQIKILLDDNVIFEMTT